MTNLDTKEAYGNSEIIKNNQNDNLQVRRLRLPEDLSRDFYKRNSFAPDQLQYDSINPEFELQQENVPRSMREMMQNGKTTVAFRDKKKNSKGDGQSKSKSNYNPKDEF